MPTDKFQKAVQIIRENIEEADFEGEKPVHLLESAERVLNLSFPDTYREFLKMFGCGDIGGEEFYGLVSENFHKSSIPDAVWLTLEERKSGLPEGLILIADTGDGSFYALNTLKLAGKECPVVIWEPGVSSPLESLPTAAPDFGSFLLQRLEDIY